jgi:hypothetical protein
MSSYLAVFSVTILTENVIATKSKGAAGKQIIQEVKNMIFDGVDRLDKHTVVTMEGQMQVAAAKECEKRGIIDSVVKILVVMTFVTRLDDFKLPAGQTGN